MSATPVPEPGVPASGVPEPSAKERLGWVTKNSRRLVISLIAVLVAAVVVVFSFSLFSSSSANPGNMVSAGIMSLDNSADGAAILTAADLLPGESGTGTVTLENTGESDGTFTLTASNLVDAPATPALSSVMTLVISDGSTTVYTGLLSGVATAPINLGSWAAGSSHTYTFAVTFNSSAGNEFQGAQTTLDFTWSAGRPA